MERDLESTKTALQEEVVRKWIFVWIYLYYHSKETSHLLEIIFLMLIHCLPCRSLNLAAPKMLIALQLNLGWDLHEEILCMYLLKTIYHKLAIYQLSTYTCIHLHFSRCECVSCFPFWNHVDLLFVWLGVTCWTRNIVFPSIAIAICSISYIQ